MSNRRSDDRDGHRLPAIDHVAIAVRDADEAAATFTRLLGWQVAGDEIVAAAGVRLVYLIAAQPVPGLEPDAQLQLVQPVAPGGVADFFAEHGEGLRHVRFRTHNIEAALRAAGEQPAGLIFTGGRGQPCAFLTGAPHGARVELTEAELP